MGMSIKEQIEELKKKLDALESANKILTKKRKAITTAVGEYAEAYQGLLDSGLKPEIIKDNGIEPVDRVLMGLYKEHQTVKRKTRADDTTPTGEDIQPADDQSVTKSESMPAMQDEEYLEAATDPAGQQYVMAQESVASSQQY